jgi:hypothetical protein
LVGASISVGCFSGGIFQFLGLLSAAFRPDDNTYIKIPTIVSRWKACDLGFLERSKKLDTERAVVAMAKALGIRGMVENLPDEG